MKVQFTVAARIELRNAFDWYEAKLPELGTRFAMAVSRAIEQVVEAPAAWPCIRGDIRKRNTPPFPFAVVYIAEGDVITIYGVVDLRSDSERWEEVLDRAK